MERAGIAPASAALALALAGCGRIDPAVEPVLPVQLSALLELEGGAPLSVIVELGRNLRDQIDLRAAAGPLLYDGRHVWEIAAGGDGAPRLTDRGGASPVALPVTGTVTGLSRRQIWGAGPSGPWVCDMERLPAWAGIPVAAADRGVACAPGPAPDPVLTHPGPGAGFALSLSGGQLRLRLPADAEGEDAALVEGVARVVGVRWVRESDPQTAPLIERLYRGRSRVEAPPLAVRVDGDLSEWRDSRPLVLQEAWHLESGGPRWRGPRDAGAGLAAARDGGRICVAGRLRDDDRSPGDRLELRLGADRWEIPLGGLADHPVAGGDTPGGFAWAVGRDWFGARYEACLPAPASDLSAPAVLPFSLRWEDVDAGEPTTVLSSAPELIPAALPLGALRLL